MKKTAAGFLFALLLLSILCPTIAANAAGTINQTISLEPNQTLTKFVDGYYTYYNNQLALTVTIGGTSGSVVVGYSTGNKKISNSVVEVTVNDCNSISIKGLSVGTATVTAKCFSQTYVGSTGSNSEWISDTTTVVYNVTVERPGFTVSYNANGGSGAPASQLKTAGEALTLSTQVPTRAGYVFRGWALNASASNAAYQPGDRYTTDSDVTLYAVWQFDHYVITYNANGGSGAPARQDKYPGTAIWLSSTVPTRQGYAFQGWAESASASVATYQAEDYFNEDRFVTLYAVWQRIPTQSIVLNKSSTTIYVDSSEQLSATVMPTNAPQSVTWSSSNSAVASVSSAGLVTGKTEGMATITATTVDGRQAPCAVTVIVDPAKRVKLDYAHFPDSSFRSLLATYDDDGNGYLGDLELEGITSLDLSNASNTASVEGIKYLTSLKQLECSFCKVVNLDLRGCEKLERIVYGDGSSNSGSGWVDYSYLKTVRADYCPSLSYVRISGKNITSIYLNGCVSLLGLSASNSTKLQTLQFSGCEAIESLDVFDSALTSLDISNLYNLKRLDCYSNSPKLRSLNISNCPAILDCYYYGSPGTSNYKDYRYNGNYFIVSSYTNITASTALKVLKQPANATVEVGETAKFQTFATGTGLSYQWQEYRNGAWSNSSLPGCDTNTLTVNSVEAVNGSRYQCIVTDDSGVSLCSDAVTLSISYPAFGTPEFITPAGTRTIGNSAFEGIAARIVTVSAGCTNIADYAFRNSSVQHIRIPASCTLGTGVFDGCESVLIYGTAGSPAEAYCLNHSNCVFVPEGN